MIMLQRKLFDETRGVFDFAVFISTTHFHASENIRKTPAWPSLIGYVGVLLFGEHAKIINASIDPQRFLFGSVWIPVPPSTITHVPLPATSDKGRIACLKATFRHYVKMKGTKDRTHPFPQLPHYVIICTHPSSPP